MYVSMFYCTQYTLLCCTLHTWEVLVSSWEFLGIREMIKESGTAVSFFVYFFLVSKNPFAFLSCSCNYLK